MREREGTRTRSVHQLVETIANVGIAAEACLPPANGRTPRLDWPVQRKQTARVRCRPRSVTGEPHV
jgi:hypothetical protein